MLFEKAHDRESQNREFVKSTLLKRGSMLGVIVILRTSIFPLLQVLKIPDAKAAVDKK